MNKSEIISKVAYLIGKEFNNCMEIMSDMDKFPINVFDIARIAIKCIEEDSDINIVSCHESETIAGSELILFAYRKTKELMSREIQSTLHTEPSQPTPPIPDNQKEIKEVIVQKDSFSILIESIVDEKLSTFKSDTVDEVAIKNIIDKKLENNKKEIVIIDRNNGNDIKDIGKQHQSFEEMMHWINMGTNVMLTGPAGSGKTTAGAKVAEALSLPFSSLSLSNDTRAYALFGFTNGEKYTTTEFRKRYETGGVFVLDEVDNGQANILSKMNSAIENGSYAFDDKVVNRHKDFILISTANTWGFGGNTQYIGRNALDAAFLDRFIKINWDYDEELELEIASNNEFTKKIQILRKAAKELKAKVIISPRASIRGGMMMDAKIKGMTESKILDALIFRGITGSIKNKIIHKAKEYLT